MQQPLYICPDCGHLFLTPSLRREAGQCFCYCPLCGSDAFEETRSCALCAALIPESQSAFDLCPRCERDVRRRFQRFFGGLADPERRYLAWLLDSRGPAAVEEGRP